MGSFWPKYTMLKLKEYWGVIFGSTGDSCKIWRKTDLGFQNWHEEFGKFLQAEKQRFYLRKNNGKTKSKSKFKTSRSTICCVKTLFYLRNTMNSRISKSFYTCSTKSLLLTYKKISKKAVKLGSFLQCKVQWTMNDIFFYKIYIFYFINFKGIQYKT